jgi:3-phenylpropionate/cinnamic acid dioxygenase small subunit
VDSAREIENLLYTYADRIDRGDFDGLAELFTHGRIEGIEGGGAEAVFEGLDRVRSLYGATTRIHEDTGTPRTKHLCTNAIIHVDEHEDETATATAQSNYLVCQATPDLPLQVVVTGRYRETFHRIEGTWWFGTRTMYVDQTGDVSHHLLS